MRSCGAEARSEQLGSSDPTEKSDTIVLVGLTMPTGFFLVSVVVGSPLENTCPSCRTYIEKKGFSSLGISWRARGMPAPGPFPEEYREEQNTGKEEEKKEEKGLRVVIEHRVGKAGSSALTRCRTKGSRASERRKYEENEGRRARRREGRVVKRSKKIRAGTEKGEKKKVKVQRGRKQPVQVQVFYYARLSRLWHSCFEEPGNLGWTEWGVSGYPARSPISLSRFSSPSASRFRCFGAPINPLLSGETPKLKKIYIYICVDMYEGGSLSLSLSLPLSLCSGRERGKRIGGGEGFR